MIQDQETPTPNEEHPVRLLVLDLHAGVSPLIEISTSQPFDPEQEAAELTQALHQLIADRYPGAEIEYVLGEPVHFSAHSKTDPVLRTPTQRRQEQREGWRSFITKLRQTAEANQPAEPPEEVFQEGLWLVQDYRHSALVRAGSDQEAIRKALDAKAVIQCCLGAEFLCSPGEIDVLEIS